MGREVSKDGPMCVEYWHCLLTTLHLTTPPPVLSAGAFMSAPVIAHLGCVYGLVLLPPCFAVAGLYYWNLKLEDDFSQGTSRWIGRASSVTRNLYGSCEAGMLDGVVVTEGSMGVQEGSATPTTSSVGSAGSVSQRLAMCREALTSFISGHLRSVRVSTPRGHKALMGYHNAARRHTGRRLLTRTWVTFAACRGQELQAHIQPALHRWYNCRVLRPIVCACGGVVQVGARIVFSSRRFSWLLLGKPSTTAASVSAFLFPEVRSSFIPSRF